MEDERRGGAEDPARLSRGPGRYRFGDVELDAGAGELLRAGRARELRPTPFQLLLYLIRHRDRWVSKDELLRGVWPNAAVGDAALAGALRDLRRAVGDDGRRQGVVRTRRGLGYRFVAKVQEARGGRPAGPRVSMRAVAPDARVPGRRAVLARIEAALDATLCGWPPILLIAGPPGIGKTHTLETLAALAQPRGFAVRMGRCYEGDGAPPFWPWTQVLRELRGVGAARSADRAATGAGGLDPDACREPDLSDIATGELAPLLATGADPAPLPHPTVLARLAQPDVRFRLFASVASRLAGAARSGPVAVLLDDLHGADVSSLRLLEFLASDLARRPVLLAAVYRDVAVDAGQPIAETLAELARHDRCERLELEGLTSEEAAGLVEELIGRPAAGELVESVRARTEGNPFFIRQLLRLCADRGEPLESVASPQAGVPPGVREVVLGRVCRMSRTTRGLLTAAAVVGREFPVAAAAGAAGVAAEEAVRSLSEARRAGLVAVEGARGRFAHALLQEALYEELDPVARGRLHARVAEVLDGEPGGRSPNGLAELAHHLREAAAAAEPGLRPALAARAVERCVEAAKSAEARLAYEDAAAHYTDAIHTLETLCEDDPVRRGELLVELAVAQRNAGERERSLESAAQAADIARRRGDARILAEAAVVRAHRTTLADPELIHVLEEALAALGDRHEELRVRLLGLLAYCVYLDGHPAEGARLAEKARRLAGGLGIARARRDADLVRHYTWHAPGRLAARVELVSQVAEEALREGQRDQAALSRCWLAVDLLEAGEMERADRLVGEIRALVREAGMAQFAPFPARWDAMRALHAGRFDEAEGRIHAAFEAGRRFEDPNAWAFFGVQWGSLMWEQGRFDELDALRRSTPERYARLPVIRAFYAASDLERGRDSGARAFDQLAAGDFAALPEDLHFLHAVSSLAEICALHLGDADRAARLYPRCVGSADQNVVFNYGIVCRGAAARTLGLLALAMHRLDDAAHHLERAAALNERCGARPYSAHVAHDRARLLLARGRRGDARHALALAREARRRARELGMGVLATRAGVAMAEAQGAIPLRRAARRSRKNDPWPR